VYITIQYLQFSFFLFACMLILQTVCFLLCSFPCFDVIYVPNYSENLLQCNEIKVMVYWVLTPCSAIGGYRCFGGTWYLHHQG
jgi:hypothetical protein